MEIMRSLIFDFVLFLFGTVFFKFCDDPDSESLCCLQQQAFSMDSGKSLLKLTSGGLPDPPPPAAPQVCK